MWNCRDGHQTSDPLMPVHTTRFYTNKTLEFAQESRCCGWGVVEVSCSVWHPAARSGHKTRRLELVTHFLMWCQKTVVSTDVLHPCGQNLWWCGTHQQSGGGRDVSQCSWRPVVSSECPGSQLKAEYTVLSHLQLQLNRCFVGSKGVVDHPQGAGLLKPGFGGQHLLSSRRVRVSSGSAQLVE